MQNLLDYSGMLRARDDLNRAVNQIHRLKQQGLVDEAACTACVEQINAILIRLISEIQQREETLHELWKTEDEDAAWRKHLDSAEQVLVDQWDSQYQSSFQSLTGPEK